MPPDRVIIVADPVGRLRFQVRERRPRAGVDQLFPVSCEERFRYGIVVADSRSSQGPPDIVLRAVLVEDSGRILAAAAGMKYHAGRRLPGGDGHVEGGGDQAGPHVRGDSPADYLEGYSGGCI